MNSLVEFDKLSADVTLFLAPIKDIAITDATSCAAALETVRRVKELVKQVTAKRVELVKPHNDFVDSVNAYAKRMTGPLGEAEAFLKSVITKYELEQERIRQAELRKLEDERIAKELAIAKERKEREAKEQTARDAEEKRIRDEAQKKLEAERREREEAEALFGAQDEAEKLAAEKAEKERLEREARARQERADLERLAEEARLERERNERDKEAKRRAAEIESARVKNMRTTWVFEVTDESAVPRQYLSVDETAIRKAVASGVREIPGVNIYAKTELAVGSRTSIAAIAKG